MKTIFCLLISLGLLSCSLPRPETMVPLQATALADTSLLRKCMALWPGNGWQFVHTIDFTVNGRKSGSLLGVTVIDLDGELRCALLTTEGLPLFEARFGGGPDGQDGHDATASDTPEILRALPPFDKPGFARGLVEDVRLLFTAPEMRNGITGRNDENLLVCRLDSPNGTTLEIIPGDRGDFDLLSYAENGRPSRRVTARGTVAVNGRLLPKKLILHAADSMDYTLTMTLVSAQHLTPDGP